MNARALAIVSLVLVAVVSSTFGTPLDFTVNQSQSSVNVQLCLLGNCDSDPSSVSGFMSAKTLPIPLPTNITLYDFIFNLTDQIDIFISFSILGNFSGTGQNLSFYYATPGNPQPPAPITANAFTLSQVPTEKSGTFQYNATGIVCSTLQGQNPPVPCNDTIDLSSTGTSDGNINGTVGVVGRTITLTMNPNISVPLDPDNPGTGSLTVTGTIVASASAPLRGDANLNGSVNSLDIQEFCRVMLDPGSSTSQKRFAVDMNDDDAFDDLDVALLVDCLLGNGCVE